jgi:glutathione peroxidase
MKFIASYSIVSIIVVILAGTLCAWNFMKSAHHYPPTPSMTSFYDLTANTLEGDLISFEALKGKRVLIVNTASKCGYTPQYADLETLHETHGGDDFVVIGFPCNDFGRQEPGSADEIASFCSKNYGVSFQIMEKVHVGGGDQHPVYSWLCSASENGVADHKVGWNFHKFLIDENGQLVASLRSGVKPLDEQIVEFAQGQ